MMSQVKLTHEEMVERIRAAVKTIPPLGKHDWKTIYLSLTRERRRVKRLFADSEAVMADEPETNAFLGKIKGEIEHIEKIMTVLGEGGHNMLIHVDHRPGLECAHRQKECGCVPNPARTTEE